MGTLALVYMTNINETMAAGTKQKVNAIYARIESENPKVHNQSVLRLEETKPGEWDMIAEGPGLVTVILEKREPGFKPETKLNVCKHIITVTGSAKNKDIVVDEIDMNSVTTHSDSDMGMTYQRRSSDDVMSDVK